ncbi:phospholipase D/nuclease [Xylaria longipes]|nr:phospholipase D/nuclease [Xylaria longipes]
MPGNEINGVREKDVADSECKIRNRLFSWCQSEDSVSSLITANPDLTPAEAWQKLFHGDNLSIPGPGDSRNTGTEQIVDEELQRTRSCGKWGPREPSDLFIKIYHDALCTLENDPKRGAVSPSLMGGNGTVPLTIISVLPDIVRHMSNLIVRAEKEVFLATNYWQDSVASRYITNAIRELSRRAEARGTRIVMKIIYDRGSPRQVFDPHYIVPESEYTGGAVKLPPAKDIPYVDLQVINFHQPVLGTFHAKYMIVDRRIGILQSDNIQDNDNLEMMVQVEGPIVDSLYDVAMISWHKKLDPPMPCLHSPVVSATEPPSFGASHANIFSSTGSIEGHSAVVDPTKMSPRKPYGIEAATVDYEQDSSVEASTRARNTTNPLESESRKTQESEQGAPEQPSAGTDVVSSEAQNASSLSTVQSPSRMDETWLEHTADDPHYDSDIAGEVSRIQASVSAKPNETAMQAVTRHLNHTQNAGFPGNAPNCNRADEMTPYIPHPAHEPFPIALVNRAPYGRPNHKSVSNPQNAAWLSALRNAQRNVFIQTPTLNAEPLIPAIVEACERGVDVYCYVCLGYNDAGEMLPMQGGHNEKVAHQLYTTLSLSGRQHLRWYWYVAKDQTRPIPASKKKRSCHIKLMIVDEHVGIVGNGNQDTQSWYHSQEINLMMDSPEICRSWIDALRRNQNTGIYGAVDNKDGIWRDEQGKEVEGATGVDSGRFSWVHGFAGALKRVQGKGGF